MCLLALKHLVSLQAHTRTSVQAELDLRLADVKRKGEIKKERNVVLFLKRLPLGGAAQSFFFFRLHRKEMHYGVCVSTIISCIVCVCSTVITALCTYRLNY